MEVQKSVAINAPPDRVWTFLSDPERILQWYLPLQRFEYVSDVRREVGAPFRFEEKVAGRVMTLECVVTEWTEPQRFSFEMTSGDMMKSYREAWTVEPTPSGSRFTFAEQGALANRMLDRVAGPLAERMSGATIKKMLAKLKMLAEA